MHGWSATSFISTVPYFFHTHPIHIQEKESNWLLNDVLPDVLQILLVELKVSNIYMTKDNERKRHKCGFLKGKCY